MPSLTRVSKDVVEATLRGASQDHTGANGWTTLAFSSREWENYVTFNPYENPGAKAKIARGEFVFSALIGERVGRTRGQRADLRVFRSRNSPSLGPIFNNCQIYGDVGADISIPPQVEVDPGGLAFNLACEEFIRRALHARQQVAGGVILGELGQTLRMLHRPYRQVFKAFEDHVQLVKKRATRSRRNPTALRKVVADTWLETQYGLLPLLSDVKGIAQGLASIVSYRLPRKRIVGQGESSRFQAFNPEDRSYNGVTWKLRYEQEFKTSCRLRGSVNITTQVPAAKFEAFGLTPSDFVPTLWELIPHSFLVDYFSNTGAVIQALSFPSAALQWVLIEYSHTATAGYSIREWKPWSGGVSDWDVISAFGSLGIPSKAIRTVVSRDKFPGVPVPTLRVQIPGLGLKWLNIAALLSTSRRVSEGLASR